MTVERSPRYFVSYTASDDHYVQSMVSALRERRPDINFFYMFGERSNETGYAEEIALEIEATDVHILLYSRDTPSGSGCLTELKMAAAEGIRPLIVLMGDLTVSEVDRGLRYHLGGEITPVRWTTPGLVADVILQRLDRQVPRTDRKPVKAIRRALIVSHAEQSGALSKALYFLRVSQDDVATKVIRAFGGSNAGKLRIEVDEPGSLRVGQIIVTRNPYPEDVTVRRIADDLNIPASTVSVRVLEEFGPYEGVDPAVHALVCQDDFPRRQGLRGRSTS